MGSLGGHILPGSFFIIFGLWWTWSIFYKYFLTLKIASNEGSLSKRRKRTLKYRSTSSFPCGCCYKIPVEGIIKIASCSIGFAGEYITAYKNGKFTHYGNIQHMTMYIFFGLNGVMDILESTGHILIPNLDYVTGILAFTMEGILFIFHLDNSKPMEVRLHVLLVLLIFASVLSGIWEVICRESVLASLSRAYFTLLQGTWFYQVGFIMFVYNWKEGTSTQMKVVAYIFGWHFAVVFLFMMAVGYFVRWKVFSSCGGQLAYDILDSEQNHIRALNLKKDISLEELTSNEEL